MGVNEDDPMQNENNWEDLFTIYKGGEKTPIQIQTMHDDEGKI